MEGRILTMLTESSTMPSMGSGTAAAAAEAAAAAAAAFPRFGAVFFSAGIGTVRWSERESVCP